MVPAGKENARAALFSELEHGNKRGTFQLRDFADESKLLPQVLSLGCWCSGTEPHGEGSPVWV